MDPARPLDELSDEQLVGLIEVLGEIHPDSRNVAIELAFELESAPYLSDVPDSVRSLRDLTGGDEKYLAAVRLIAAGAAADFADGSFPVDGILRPVTDGAARLPTSSLEARVRGLANLEPSIVDVSAEVGECARRVQSLVDDLHADRTHLSRDQWFGDLLAEVRRLTSFPTEPLGLLQASRLVARVVGKELGALATDELGTRSVLADIAVGELYESRLLPEPHDEGTFVFR